MSRCVIQCGWGDVPHLTDAMIEKMTDGMMPHLKEARMLGKPTLGSGAIYPVDEEDIKFDPQLFKVSDAWRRCMSLDVGWKKNAGIWGAYDEENDTIYLYDEYYRGYAEPLIHASAIKARGAWIPCIIDSAANGSNQNNGEKLKELYEEEGLNCINANKTIEPGLLSVYQRLSTGRLKVSKNLVNWFNEYRIYRRDEKGKIVKENDHLMDATRYLIMGLENFIHMPVHLYAGKKSNQNRITEVYEPYESMNNQDQCNNDYDPYDNL